MMQRSNGYLVFCAIGVLLLCASCRGTNFAGADPTPATAPPSGTTTAGTNAPGPAGPQSPGQSANAALTPGTTCTPVYTVPGTANPYLAGEPGGTSISYTVTDSSNPVDTTPAESPVQTQMAANCMTAGAVIGFKVSGSITFNPNQPPNDANGTQSIICPHQKGSVFGKSNITAPITSFIGLFTNGSDPSSAPSNLDFSTQAERDYAALSPQLGQIFYIGNGQTSSGAYHQVTVPQGASQLYLAVMDCYQWNNNSGSLSGSVFLFH